jgi:hypothetical protein
LSIIATIIYMVLGKTEEGEEQDGPADAPHEAASDFEGADPANTV